MLKQLYKSTAWVLFLISMGACSNEQLNNELAPGNTPIQLSGALTRATGENGSLITTGNPLADYKANNVKFYLSARTTDNKPYFSNMDMSIGNNESDGRNDLDSKVYYPLGGTEINLYAHTGKAATGTPPTTIPLTSGTALSNDILFGKGTDGTGSTVVSGKSDDPIKYITFKHLMTKVEVKMEIDGTVEDQKPSNISMTFNNSAIVKEGNYDMLNETATSNTQDYTLTGSSTGIVHYLVPTGKTISGTGIIKSLKIDDYTASGTDLAALIIPQAEKSDGLGGTISSDFKLESGLSYTLTFQIKRLKLTGIKLTLNPWTLSKGSSNWDYAPYRVNLTVNGYSATNKYDVTKDENKITKMVLKYNDGSTIYQYIGTGELDGAVAYTDFVTLPSGDLSGGTLAADLYTKDGLLIKDVEVTLPAGTTSLSNGGNLSFDLSINGLKQNTGGYYEITTPLQFALVMKNPQSDTYRLMDNIDMDNTSIAFEPANFPSGATLDGNQHNILHLQMTGNGLVPANDGILKNIRIASGTITTGSGTYAGGICGTNNGSIEGCVNEANIAASDSQIVGGICGLNTGTILACLNTGNSLKGMTVGGICGENSNAITGAIKACLNVGLLNREATNLGGICGSYTGTGSNKVIDTSYWLTGTARTNQAISNEVAIGLVPTGTTVTDFTNIVSDLAPETIRSSIIISNLSTAAGSSWNFELNPMESSWPIPVPIP